jgi:agmatine/peptidylarginine deiminase
MIKTHLRCKMKRSDFKPVLRNLVTLIALFGLVVMQAAASDLAGTGEGETMVRHPAFGWDDLIPPKYIPNWQGVPDELRVPSPSLTPPPKEPVRWTAQWEEREGVLLAWPLGWRAVNSAYCAMVDELQDVGTVYLLYASELARKIITRRLSSCGVSLVNIEWLNIPYNSNWTRDYGPQNIWDQESGNWGIVDNRCTYGRKDNSVNSELHYLWGMDYYESPIVTEGGNMCTDGMGRVFATSWVLRENFFMSEAELHQAFRDYLNAELVVLPWPPVSPHLDMSAKLVDPETWIIGEWPADDPNTPLMDEMVAILEGMTSSTGNPYTIYRIKQPDRLPYGYWRTYTNAYMQNGKVLVPTFGVEQDSAALAVFQQALPGWEIVGIDCTGYDGSGGAIHCSTHGIASQDQIYKSYKILPE